MHMNITYGIKLLYPVVLFSKLSFI